jgi:hypothetical protein
VAFGDLPCSPGRITPQPLICHAPQQLGCYSHYRKLFGAQTSDPLWEGKRSGLSPDWGHICRIQALDGLQTPTCGTREVLDITTPEFQKPW